jgi:hypothetical protein
MKSVVESTVNETRLTDDVHIAALALVNQKLLPKPVLRESDQRIVFEFSKDITPSLTAYWENLSIPISDYLQALRRVKSILTAAKGRRGAF